MSVRPSHDPKFLRPVWQGDTVEGESLLFTRDPKTALRKHLCYAQVLSTLLVPPQSSKRLRRVLYNFDGDSCLSTKAGSKGPVPVNDAAFDSDLRNVFDPKE